MLTLSMPKPKSDVQMVNFNARVPLELREKAAIAATLLDSDLSKEARKFLKDLVKRAEDKHGPIVLPAPALPQQ